MSSQPHNAQVGELYRGHHSWLRGWLFKRLECQHQAADLAQDTFLRLLGRDTLNGLREPRAFLATIAKGLVVDHYRRLSLERAWLDSLAALPEPEAPSAEARVLVLETLVEIDRMLDGLKPKVRSAFLLSQLDGLTYPQIAEQLGAAVYDSGVRPLLPGALFVSTVEPTAQVVAQAIDWRVRLASGLAPVEELEACLRWRKLHPSHEQAWQRLAVFDGRLGAMPPPQASQALRYRDRRTVLKGLVLLLGTTAAAGGASLGLRGTPWLAQQRTATGERRRLQLPDGGWLQMNSGTALDVAFDSQQRRVQLLAGEIMIQTGKHGAERPFWVDTPLGSLQALGTGFSVRLHEDSASLAVEEGAVAVRPSTLQQAAAIVHAGEQVRFDRQGVFATQPLDRDALAWREGYLVVRQWPLGRLCAELGRYRSGVLRCDPAVADLLISGVFPLDEPDRALAALGRSLPVRARYLTRWWVTLEPA